MFHGQATKQPLKNIEDQTTDKCVCSLALIHFLPFIIIWFEMVALIAQALALLLLIGASEWNALEAMRRSWILGRGGPASPPWVRLRSSKPPVVSHQPR